MPGLPSATHLLKPAWSAGKGPFRIRFFVSPARCAIPVTLYGIGLAKPDETSSAPDAGTSAVRGGGHYRCHNGLRG